MKKIVELCGRDLDGKCIPDAVKLRLRGRGSGYKEGPYNRGNFLFLYFLKNLESDEPLHLCISSKFQDKYKRACTLVQELIISVYEEFKRFCERNGKTPSTNLTIQKEESVSSRRAGLPGNLSSGSNVFVDN